MTTICPVCEQTNTEVIFESSSQHALTSLCELRPGRVRVQQCSNCAHLFSEELSDTREYYANDYRILLNHDDEDQIYEVLDGDIVYRTAHQLKVMQSKLPLPPGTRLLDYGCAKAAMPQRLIDSNDGLDVHLFDVSTMYKPFWEKFVPLDHCAIDAIPSSWLSSFDVVTSFFSLEHIPQPGETVHRIRSLLRDGGRFYGIVPDTLGNVADFVVIDHVNHFTEKSLTTLLLKAGFHSIEIDRHAHRGALVFTARCNGAVTAVPHADLEEAKRIAAFWDSLSIRIQRIESRLGDTPSAIYGSGFYGVYIASLLKKPQNLLAFLDASPYQQGKYIMDRPVIRPTELADKAGVLYIGLNPAIARKTVAGMEWLKDKNIKTVFLTEDEE
jgi:SAM-dependent methyltransferase